MAICMTTTLVNHPHKPLLTIALPTKPLWLCPVFVASCCFDPLGDIVEAVHCSSLLLRASQSNSLRICIQIWAVDVVAALVLSHGLLAGPSESICQDSLARLDQVCLLVTVSTGNCWIKGEHECWVHCWLADSKGNHHFLRETSLYYWKIKLFSFAPPRQKRWKNNTTTYNNWLVVEPPRKHISQPTNHFLKPPTKQLLSRSEVVEYPDRSIIADVGVQNHISFFGHGCRSQAGSDTNMALNGIQVIKNHHWCSWICNKLHVFLYFIHSDMRLSVYITYTQV